MGKERNTASCPADAKCPSNRYCRAAAIGPARSDGPKGKTIKQRQKSALNKMRLINKTRKSDGRPRAELYKPARDKNGNLIPAKNGKPGHIIVYACYPQSEHQKEFGKKYRVFSNALAEAMTNVCTVDNGFKKPSDKSRCVQKHIKSDPDVIAFKKVNGI